MTHNDQIILQWKEKCCYSLVKGMGAVSVLGADTAVCGASVCKSLGTAPHSLDGNCSSSIKTPPPAPLLPSKSYTGYPSRPTWLLILLTKKNPSNWDPFHVQPPHWNNPHILDYSNEKMGAARLCFCPQVTLLQFGARGIRKKAPHSKCVVALPFHFCNIKPSKKTERGESPICTEYPKRP